MSTAFGPYQVGASCTDIHIIAGTLNSSGVFVVGETIHLEGELLAANLEHRFRTASIKPITMFGMNMVPVEGGGFGQIRALKTTGAAAKLGYIKSLYTHGFVYRVSGRDSYAGFFVFSNLGTPHEGIEQQDETLDLEPCQLVGENQLVRVTL